MSSPNIARRLTPNYSLTMWAVFGVCLAAFSYVFTVALAALCGVLGFWTARFSFAGMENQRTGLQLLILVLLGAICLFAMAATLLWSLIPRRMPGDTPPLAQLTRDAHPRLFSEIARIAWELGEPLPEHVYLAVDLNASVEQS